MKVAVDIDSKEVTLAIGAQGGIISTVSMTPEAAEFAADALIAAAKTIRKHRDTEDDNGQD